MAYSSCQISFSAEKSPPQRELLLVQRIPEGSPHTHKNKKDADKQTSRQKQWKQEARCDGNKKPQQGCKKSGKDRCFKAQCTSCTEKDAD